MEPGRTYSRFQTTSWTQIVGARDGGAEMESLLERYWSPVYAFIRRSNRSREDAADLTQAFLMSILESKALIERADPDRGRFRSFLTAALKRFLIDDHRRTHGRDGERKRDRPFVPASHAVLEHVEPREGDDPLRAFERQWATATLDQALTRLERSCRARKIEAQWEVFECRVLNPAKQGCEPAPVEEMMAALGVQTAQEVYSAIQTMKRRLHRELCAVIAETVEDPTEIDAELANLRAALSPG